MTTAKHKPTPEEQYEEDLRAFRKNGEPAAYICFVWPELNRWQAIAAWKQHRELIPLVLEMLNESARAFKEHNPSEKYMLGVALNTLAECVLQQVDNAMMGGLLTYISDVKREKYMYAIVERSGDGSLSQLYAMDGVSNVADAHRFVDSLPAVKHAKERLLADLMRGSTQ